MRDEPDILEIMEEPRDEIARLEVRVEELAENLERCRKLAVFSKVLVAGGAAWLVAGLLGFMSFGPTPGIASIAAVLGGIVLNGSNSSTMQQIQASIDTAEARRRELIGSIELRTVNADLTGATPQAGRWLH